METTTIIPTFSDGWQFIDDFAHFRRCFISSWFKSSEICLRQKLNEVVFGEVFQISLAILVIYMQVTDNSSKMVFIRETKMTRSKNNGS